MSLDTAKAVATFLDSNDIGYVSIMGGEFWLNPDWSEIVPMLTRNHKTVRLVTNGDWIVREEREQIVDVCRSLDDRLRVSISKDRHHHNKHVGECFSVLEENGIRCNVATEEKTTEDSLVPIGRHAFEYNLFSSFSTYCTKPECRYVNLITENGSIHKCPFGIWDYDNVSNFQDGGFAERFKAFGKLFYGTFIPNCRTCLRAYEQVLAEETKQNQFKEECKLD